MILARIIYAFVAAFVAELARQLPQPPVPTPEQRALGHASELAGWLWDRYRDPEHDPRSSPGGRSYAIILAAVLDDEDIRALAQHIQAEHTDCEDAPPLSHEVYL